MMDPILLEVFWNRLTSIAHEAAVALMRASFSSVLSEAGDISFGIFDPEGNMMAQAEIGTPGHIYSIATGVKQFLKKFPAHALEPGDSLIGNDPWLFSGHKIDLTVATPIFSDGKLASFFASTCHVMDMGGRGWSADSTDLFEEGLEIPLMKIYKRGEPNQELFEIIADNVREPDSVIGDIRAQVSANEIAGEMIREFMRVYGLESLMPLSKAMRGKSEERMRQAIKAIPNGSYSGEASFDGFEEILKIALQVTIEDDGILVDFSGTSPQIGRALNSTYQWTCGYTVYPLKCMICPDVPNNEGTLRPIRITAPEGCILNARRPAPVGARQITGMFISPALLQALSNVIPDKVIADSGVHSALQFRGTKGNGDSWSSVFFSTPGMGARPTKDGFSTVGYPVNISNTPLEIIEADSPLFFLERSLVCDSGGAGKFRGGVGQRQRIKLAGEGSWEFAPMIDRVRVPAKGFFGGLSGSPADVVVNDERRPHPKTKFNLEKDDVLTIQLAGGGGFYSPLERDPELVLSDVLNGYISSEAARIIYGVALDSNGKKVDNKLTKQIRSNSLASKAEAPD